MNTISKKMAKAIFILVAYLSTTTLYAQNTYDNNTATTQEQTKVANKTLEDLGLQAQIYRRVSLDVSKPELLTNFGAMRNYQLTPGDIFSLSVKAGRATSLSTDSDDLATYPIQLLEDYTIELPLIGNIQCKGKSFLQLQKEVIRSIKSTFSVFYVNFTFERPASFSVFVYGAVENPGRIQATPLHTLSHAIGEKGGFLEGASYRLIELKRNGKIIKIDLSKYYSFADESQNPYLQPGDEIYIPLAKKIVQVNGKVQKPGILEVIENESVYDILAMAGGLTLDAETANYEIERIIGFSGERLYVNNELSNANSDIPENGDRIYIRSITENAQMITIDGAIYGARESKFFPEAAPTAPYRIHIPYTKGTTVLSALDTVGGPTPYAIMKKAFVKRRGSVVQEPLNLTKLWETRDKKYDVELNPGDSVIVPIQILKIFVAGEVKSPGAFDFSNSFTPLDYIMMAGGYKDSANMRKLYYIDENGKAKELSLSSELEPGKILYVRKNHATEVGLALENVTVYTNFINTLLGVANGFLYFERQIKDNKILNK